MVNSDVINNSFVNVYDSAKANATCLISKINEKVQNITLSIFTSLQSYFRRPLDILSEIFWPYDVKEADDKVENTMIERLFVNALEYSSTQELDKKPDITDEPVMALESYITAPTTALYLFLNYAYIPYNIMQNNIPSSFLETAVAVNHIQPLLLMSCDRGLDLKFLKTQELLPAGDAIDQCIYQGFTILVASSLDMLSLGEAKKPIHFAVASIVNLPIVQNRFLSLEPVRDLNKKTHLFLDDVRERVKKPLARQFKQMLIENSKKYLVPKIGPAVEYIKKSEEVEDFFGFSDAGFSDFPDLSCLFNNAVGKFACTLVEEKLDEVMKPTINKALDKTANKAADFAIDQTIGLGKSVFKAYCLNKMLVAASTNVPVLGALSLVLDGGKKQTLRDLSLRVSGAAIFILTGSTFYPMLLINIPAAIDLFMGIQRRHTKTEGGLQEPAIEVFSDMLAKMFDSTAKFIESRKPIKITSVPVYENIIRKKTRKLGLNQNPFRE